MTAPYIQATQIEIGCYPDERESREVQVLLTLCQPHDPDEPNGTVVPQMHMGAKIKTPEQMSDLIQRLQHFAGLTWKRPELPGFPHYCPECKADDYGNVECENCVRFADHLTEEARGILIQGIRGRGDG